MKFISQIAASHHTLYALCSDGSIWESTGPGQWVLLDTPFASTIPTPLVPFVPTKPLDIGHYGTFEGLNIPEIRKRLDELFSPPNLDHGMAWKFIRELDAALKFNGH